MSAEQAKVFPIRPDETPQAPEGEQSIANTRDQLDETLSPAEKAIQNLVDAQAALSNPTYLSSKTTVLYLQALNVYTKTSGSWTPEERNMAEAMLDSVASGIRKNIGTPEAGIQFEDMVIRIKEGR